MENLEPKERQQSFYDWMKDLLEKEPSREELKMIELEFENASEKNETDRTIRIMEILAKYGYMGYWDLDPEKPEKENHWIIKKL